eukprot:6186249-Pleurochrysis_carterae.AAC.1
MGRTFAARLRDNGTLNEAGLKKALERLGGGEAGAKCRRAMCVWERHEYRAGDNAIKTQGAEKSGAQENRCQVIGGSRKAWGETRCGWGCVDGYK